MATENTVLARPEIDLETAKQVVFDLYGLKVIKISELNGYDDRNFHVVVDERFNKNPFIGKVLKDGYVFKVINTLDSQDTKGFEAQTELMMFLNQNDIKCPKPVLTKDQKPFHIISLRSGRHISRLLEFIPGDILYKVKNPSEELFFHVGVLTARMDDALKNFDHPAYRKNVKWCLAAAPDILSDIHAVEKKRHILVKSIISEFSSRVLKIEHRLPKGIIHGDINEQNLITETANHKTIVKAVIDFGDTHYCCYLYELALAMTYIIFLTNDVDSGGHVLAGYCSVKEVSEEEFSLLKICVMTRFCQSLVLGAYASLQDPGNEYVLTTAKKGWGLLEQLTCESEDALLSRWKKISISH